MGPVTRRKESLLTVGGMLAALTLLFGVLGLEWSTLFDPGRTKPLTDIEYYRNALAAVAAGRPLFDLLGYPPFALLPLAPLGWFPVRQAEQLWTVLGMLGAIGLAALMVWLCRREPGRPPARSTAFSVTGSVALAAFLLLFSDPVHSQLLNGQISMFVLLLAFIDGCGLLPRRLQGSLIGIAGAIKLTPMLFVPYYLVTGQRRQALTATASFLAATGVGFALYPRDSVDFWTHLGSTTRFGDLSLRHDNLSLFGTISRWVADPAVARYGWYALVLAVGVVALLRARAHFRRGEIVQATLVVGTASVALSPVSWPHHQIWLVLVGIWLLWTPRALDRVLGAGVIGLYSLAFNALYGRPFSPDLLTFVVWESRALVPVLICLTGLPQTRKITDVH